MELNHLIEEVREETRMCLGIFHKGQKNEDSCETIIHDEVLIAPRITRMVTNMFITSLSDRDIYLNTVWQGGRSHMLETQT